MSLTDDKAATSAEVQLAAALREIDRLTQAYDERARDIQRLCVANTELGQLCMRHLAKLERVVETLQVIYRHDTTRYEHHQPRAWDGLTPREAGTDGTIWLTPRELARAALVALEAEVPDSFLEMRERLKRSQTGQLEPDPKPEGSSC